jgi:antitoxin component of RelBE/YafQ-DinJ toxin-antitoxin module
MTSMNLELSDRLQSWLASAAAAKQLPVEAFIVKTLEEISGEAQRVMTLDDAIARTLSEKRELYERLAR